MARQLENSERERGLGRIDLGQFTASDGTRIVYDDEGEGRPLVLLHGLMADRTFFQAQNDLAADFRLVAIDLRGHGDSRADGGLTVERLGDDIAELVDRLGLEDAIGIGWSLGASVLWRMLAGPASSRFAGAVIVDMTPRVMNDDDWQLGLSSEACEGRRQAIETDFEAFATGAGEAIFRPTGTPETQAAAEGAGRRFAANDAHSISALWSSLMQQDFRAALARIRQPTLIVHGAHSHLYGPDTADHLAAAIPDSRIVRFEQSGHSPHIEQPELFNRTLKQFAQSLPRVRQTQASI